MYKLICNFFQVSLKSLLELSNKNYITNASALAYTTILSIIPLLSVFIYIASLSKYLYKLNELARDYVSQNLLPSTGGKLIEFLNTISHQANEVPTTSFIFLFVTAILLIMSIDRTMRIVWHNYTGKRKLSEFLVYILCIFIIPVIVALASTLGAFLFNIFNHIPVLNILIRLAPLAINSIMLFIFYYATARKGINWHHILYGSLFTSVLLELLKAAFRIYVTNISNYQNIYGALSIIPVFLIWIFIFWSTVIYGALVARNMSSRFMS